MKSFIKVLCIIGLYGFVGPVVAQPSIFPDGFKAKQASNSFISKKFNACTVTYKKLLWEAILHAFATMSITRDPHHVSLQIHQYEEPLI